MPLSSRTRYVLRLAITLAILVGLVVAVRDDRVGQAFGSLSLRALVLGTLFSVAATIVAPALVTYQTKGGSEMGMTVWQLVRINLAIRFYRMVLPSATATGIRWFRYQRASNRSSAAALVLLEKLVQLFVYGVLTVVFAVTQLGRVDSRILPFLAVAVAVTVVSGTAVSTFFSSKLDRVLMKFAWTTRIRWLGRVFERVVAGALQYRGHDPKVLVILMAWSVTGFFLFVASGYVIVGDLGLAVPFVGLAWIRGVLFMATQLPFTVAGIGVREVGFVGLLGLYGIDRGSALGFALCLLLIQVIIGAIGGLLEAIDLVRPPQSGEREHRPDPADIVS